MSRDFGVNQGLVEELFLRYCANPSSVAEEWRLFFANLPPEETPELTSPGLIKAPEDHLVGAGDAFGPTGRVVSPLDGGNGAEVELPPTAEVVPFLDRRMADRTSLPPSRERLAANALQGRVSALVNAYRVRGHLFANLDPLGLTIAPEDELVLDRYGLDLVDPEMVFATGDLAGPAALPLGEIVRRLRETYCRSIGVEFTFIEEPAIRHWLQERMESSCNRIDLAVDEQLRILTKLTDAELLEQFLHTNYRGAKRFSLEGAESLIPMLDYLVNRAGGLGVDEVVIGMAHRGRLNVLVNTMEKPLLELFAEFEDPDPEARLGAGDVKYHLGYSSDRVAPDGHRTHLTLSFNPSHLEFVNPVVEGRVRAKQDRRRDVARTSVLPLLIHGDAAFAGQGVVAETLNLCQLEGYHTGGTIHVVINNQIGFTTRPGDSRSTRYCTDITRMLRCPVFHVNGEDPEAVAQVIRLATEYRQRFHQDVVIDLFCYRLYGHNEGDEPRFTQPVMYEAIAKKRSIRNVYIDRLLEGGKVTERQAEDIKDRCVAALEAALLETRNGARLAAPSSMAGLWQGYRGGPDENVADVETAVPEATLHRLAEGLGRVPPGFTANQKIRRLLKLRRTAVVESQPFDWGTAEALAIASLLVEGTPVRITGQDTRRGTFSHRHAVLYDAIDGTPVCPFDGLSDDQAPLQIVDSPLSEAGVLGFEYGFSLDSPDALVIWEAQFGDFANSAQVIIDQFIVSSEDKWNRLSGLVLLLPHGFEGQGPEHSSARLERFLTMCAEDNMQVCNLTSPGQLFHALRRQIVRPWRKPLVIMSPKSLLRHPLARSTTQDLASGTFQRIIPDAEIDPNEARRVLLCSGKVYFDLQQARDAGNIKDVAIIRIEQLYPLRPREIAEVLRPYRDGTDLVWVQEEPWNMGAWYFIQAHLPPMLEGRLPLRLLSRPESASPATGSHSSHKLEQKRLVTQSIA